MREYVQIAQRLFNTPLFIHPDKAAAILHALNTRIGVDLSELPQPEANRFAGKYSREGRPYGLSKISNGVAIISVVGSLVNRGSWVGAYSGMVSYEGIAAQLMDAANDPEAKAILLDMDSYGGEATGMVQMANVVAHVATMKPVVAVANDAICSAAYGIASQAHEIWSSPSSFIGSIGTIIVHIDQSEAMKMEGLKPTIIRSGSKKALGMGIEPLSKEARAHLEGIVATYTDLFMGVVERGRGSKFTAEDAREAEAAVFIGQEAVDKGLADKIGSFDDALRYLSTTGAAGFGMRKVAPIGARIETGARMMTQTNPQSDAPAAPALTQADVDKARAEGAAAERTRIKSILECPQAQGRSKLAATLAFQEGMGAEQAARIMEAAAVEQPAPGVPSLDARMAEVKSGPVAETTETKPAAGKHGEAADWGKLYAS